MRRPIRTPSSFRDDTPQRLVRGVLSLSRGGTGFLAPEGGGEDLVVPERHVGDALPGDVVEAAMLPPERGESRPAARVLRVLKRGARDVVCTLRRTGRVWTAVPLVPFGGRTFNVRDRRGAEEGDRVVVRFSAWDNPALNPDAELVAVIGPAADPSLDTRAVERAWDLRTEFPPEALREASAAAAFAADGAGREDLRGATIVTIDPESAKDFDDALSLSRDPAGRAVLGVHIADVSHFVRPGSALDAEARARGTSVYLVDHVLPMLPEQLSNGVCSLVEGEDRLAFSAFLTFDAAGRMVEKRFAKSVIRSTRRLRYADALAVIRGREDARDLQGRPIPPEVRELVLGCHALASRLRKNRMARFSLDISTPEPVVTLGPDGRVASIAPAEHDEAHELVEEAMIAANEAVATALAAARVPHLCRFHDAPAAEKLEELEASLASVGLHVGAIKDAGAIVRLLKAVRDTPLRDWVSGMVLRSLKRAEYSADEEGHFGLAKRHYSHFTSPIRRYPDLVLHRQLAALLAGDRASQPSRESLRAIARESSATEFRADQAERSLVEIKKYRFLEDQLAAGRPLEYDAVVVKCMPFGAFVELPELMLEGMVHVSALSSAFVRYDRSSGRLSAPGLDIGPGSRMRVFAASVDFDARKIAFKASSVERDVPASALPRLSAKAEKRRERREEKPPRRVSKREEKARRRSAEAKAPAKRKRK